MPEVDFLGRFHKATKRNYMQRMVAHDKAACADIAKRWGRDYWDGDRRHGYGGFRYDGRWRALAEEMARHYGLKAGDRILDIGCGKGFLLYEFTQAVPGIEVSGIDISEYGIEHAKIEIAANLRLGDCTELPWPDGTFDFVYSINTFHNLFNYQLDRALKEMQRVGTGPKKYICVESYRNEQEKVNLMCWQLTCESFYTPEEWRWFYDKCGYDGDYGFIYFE